MAIRVPSLAFIAARRRALGVLARKSGGCTQADLVRRGFSTVVIGHLVVTGLATWHEARGKRRLRLDITAPGRAAIRRPDEL
jgi:hypothetical protein